MSGYSDRESELRLLSCMMTDDQSWSKVADLVGGGDFSDAILSSIYASIASLTQDGKRPDRAVVRSATLMALPVRVGVNNGLQLDKRLDAIDATPGHGSNATNYAESVQQHSIMRKMDAVVQQIKAGIDAKVDPAAVAAKGMDGLLHAVSRSSALRSTMSYGSLQEEFQSTLRREATLRASGEEVGIHFGMAAVDDYTHGIRYEDGDLMILAGDPGVGKTALAMDLIRRYALKQRGLAAPGGSLFLSLEMGRFGTAMRWSQMGANLTSTKIRSGMDVADIDALQTKMDDEADLPLWINFEESLYVDQIKAIIANEVRLHGVKFVVIDHMRRLNMRGRMSENELDEARARYVKAEICKRLGVSVLMLAHSTKASSGRDDKRPQADDLRGSRQITAEADAVAFMHRPFLTASQEQRDNGLYSIDEAYLVWTKNRNGRVDDAPFTFRGATMTIEEAATYGLPATGKPVPPPHHEPVQHQMGEGEW